MSIEKMLPELVLLSVVIMATVGWLKKMDLHGQWLTGAAFAVGFVLGIGYRYAVAPMNDFASWFIAVVFSLLCGGIATGVYKTGQNIAGTDPAGVAADLKAENKQTAKVIAAIDFKDQPNP